MWKGKLTALLIQIQIQIPILKREIPSLQRCFVSSFYEVGIHADFFEELRVVREGVLLGILFGYYYHMIEVFRRYVKHGRFLCGFEDVAYIVKTVYVFCVFLLAKHHGAIRWYLVAAVLLGVTVWRVACKLIKIVSNICVNSNKRM